MRSLCVIALLMWAARAHAADIYQRLRNALPAPVADQAIAELARHDFPRVQSLLSQQEAAGGVTVVALEGAIAFLAGNMHQSIASFSRAAALGPLSDADRFTYAMALVKTGADQTAREQLSALAAAHPQQALYTYWLGRLDYDQRRYEEAVTMLQHAVQLDSQSARIWDALGLAFDMQGRMEQALDAFQKAVARNRAQTQPSRWPPHNLGYLLLRMNRYSEAESALRESLRYDPSFALAEYHLARVLEKEDQNMAAIEAYRKAIAADPASPDPCYSLAELYRKLHRESEAKAMFTEYRRRKALQAQP